MHQRGSPAPRRDRTGKGQERGLTTATFIGSFPAVDFRLRPALPEIALLGRSNVGKSSLLNALVGRRKLAHTSKTPGKTRMCNVYNVEHRYYLVDLPGYGYARASKTARRGVQTLLQEYLSARQALAGAVWLLDVRRDPSNDDLAMATTLAEKRIPVLVAITKADKFGRGRRRERTQSILRQVEIPEDQCVLTSSRTRNGIEELREAIDALAEGRSGGRAVRRS